jgi:C4-dicarboxylate-specific signal transduction histidine kinase
VAGIVALGLLTLVCHRLRLNLATAVCLYLIVVVLLSVQGNFLSSAVVSLIAVACLMYYFAPPIFSFRVKDQFEVVAIIVFLTTSALITHFVSRVRKSAEELRQSQANLAHVSRVTTMGELTASLAHEINQPIAAAATDANTCLRWLAREQPDVEEAREAALRVVKDTTRAAEIISRIRLLFKKSTPQRELVDVNEVVREMIVLARSEATRYKILVGTDLATDLPQVTGDRVQLQQVLMNLMMNSIDAMKDVDGTRELMIKSGRAEKEQVLVSVSDTGVGLPAQQADQIFNAFFTTKLHGTGMGLRISRSILESHGGRLWAENNSPRGANFYFTISSKVEAHE